MLLLHYFISMKRAEAESKLYSSAFRSGVVFVKQMHANCVITNAYIQYTHLAYICDALRDREERERGMQSIGMENLAEKHDARRYTETCYSDINPF